MKILMVAPRFSPKSGGGGYVITKNLVKELLKKEYGVEICTSDYQYEKSDDLHESMFFYIKTFHTFKTIMGFHITIDLIKWADAYLSLNPKTDWDYPYWINDVIHLQGCRTFQNIVVSYYARKYKIPYIVDAHGFPIQGTWFHKLILRTFDWLFANKIVRGASMCIAETEVGKQEYLRAGVKEDKIRIIPCPYDLSIFDNLPPRGEFKKKYGIKPDSKIVGFLGGLDRIKGLDFLVKSFAKLKDRNDLYLVLAGTDMGFKDELDVLIGQLELRNSVIYTGYISGRDKLEYLVDCDVCVFPSRAEQGLPFAGLEAIMCGTPLVVTEGTGSADDVDKMKCGIVSNPKMLHIHIRRMLDLRIGFGDEYVKAGQGYIRKNLSIKEKVKDYEKVYGQVLNDISI